MVSQFTYRHCLYFYTVCVCVCNYLTPACGYTLQDKISSKENKNNYTIQPLKHMGEKYHLRSSLERYEK